MSGNLLKIVAIAEYISAYARFCATQLLEPLPKGWRCLSSPLRVADPGVDHLSGSNFSGSENMVGSIEMKRFDMPIAVY